MIERPPAYDLPRITLGVLAIGVMTAASVWVMRPFVPAVVWATMIVIATWPILLAVQARLGGRRGWAVAVMVVALTALLVVPIWLGISTIAENSDRMGQFIHSLATEGLPPPPGWLERVPVVGPKAVEQWSEFSGRPESLVARIQPHMKEVASWVADKAGGLGSTLVQFALTVLVAGILYASGESAARGVLRFLRRLAGERGENAGRLAGKAVRAVALGIVVTAVAQTLIAGAGLALAGVPHAGLLTAVVFVLCIAQLGPLLVAAPATIWLYTSGSVGRGTLLLVFSVVAVTLDNVLRPVLIRKGADLPLLLILAGVIGGVLSFGIVGLFIGPVLLAVTWTLLASWVDDLDRAPVDPAQPEP
ncbi:MAG: AI-2E family transporter YdiK [Deltaproteobacteria bacterium]|nr:AI-2E family transporter YdiK [Deltaproteobacteria bacterium]